MSTELQFPSATSIFHHAPSPSISPSLPSLSQKGKSILITGGGSGMGAHFGLPFAEAGASRIALLGRRLEPLLAVKKSITEKYPNVDVFTASVDIGKKEQVDGAFKEFVGDAGKIDVLISNAASIGPKAVIGELDANDLATFMHESVTGVAHLVEAFLRHKAEGATVVNVSSGSAYLVVAPKYHAYGIAKAAIIKIWDSVLASHPDLFVYHTQPGQIDSNMSRTFHDKMVEGPGALSPDEPTLPACFNVWLASPEARFLNGRFVWANWDVDELKSRAEETKKSEEFKFGVAGWARYAANVGPYAAKE